MTTTTTGSSPVQFSPKDSLEEIPSEREKGQEGLEASPLSKEGVRVSGDWLPGLQPKEMKPQWVRKRDGSEVEFDVRKVESAVRRAGEATGEYGPDRARTLMACVVSSLRLREQDRITVEDIQDAVELTLMNAGHFRTARSYVLFREQHRILREDKRVFVEVSSSVEEYVGRRDWRINANANQGYSLGGMILNMAGKVTANYWLNHVYPPEVGQAHQSGDFHVHDLDMLSGYCAGWSLRTLLQEGYNGVPNKIEARAPKHLRTALGQMVNFLGTLQNEWAGAQAFSSFDTYLAPYVRRDNLSDEDLKQCLQEFIHNLNVPSRWGTQTPFTNLTFDWTCPADLAEQEAMVAGESIGLCYGDLQPEMDRINRAFLEVMGEGDARGRVFTFPIPTYNITPDFNWEHPNCELLFTMTARYGLPYFQNFLNSDLQPQHIRSMCCRLQLDLRELLKRGNGLFGSAEQTGSIGVVTINCARLGYLHSGQREALYRRLDHLLNLASRSLELKREMIQELMDGGLYPYTRRYLGTLRNHFSTIGINGLNECVLNFTGGAQDLTTPQGRAMGLELLEHVRRRMTEFQEKTGHLYNLEASPAEGATYRFAREDRKRYPDILQAGTVDAPYYTNSSQLPVGLTEDPFEVLEHQEEFQRLYTGGTVVHLYMAEQISSAKACKNLVRRVLERYRIPYLTITPTFSICADHGYLKGEQSTCPHCGKATEIWTRVMGYHRPVSQFNKGKQSEHRERKFFIESRAA